MAHVMSMVVGDRIVVGGSLVRIETIVHTLGGKYDVRLMIRYRDETSEWIAANYTDEFRCLSATQSRPGSN